MVVADVFNKKIIKEALAIHFIIFPLSYLIFNSYQTSPVITTLCVPLVIFLYNSQIKHLFILFVEDDYIDYQTHIFSRKYIFSIFNKSNFTYPINLYLVNQPTKYTANDFVVLLRNLCGNQIFCRYSANCYLVISKKYLDSRLEDFNLSYSTQTLLSPPLDPDQILHVLESQLSVFNYKFAKQREKALSNSVQLATIGQLAAGLAHEIRNPLTAVKGFLQLYKLGHTLDNETITLMKIELNRINQLVTDLLLLSIPSFDTVNLETHDINQLLYEISEFVKPELEKSGVLLTLNLSPLPPVLIDRNQIKQVILNLIQNAIQAVSKQQGQIILKTTCSNSQVIIKIIDHGPGIPVNIQNKIFLPFFTTKEHGTGLGLTICQQLVKAHAGDITILSSPGTTVAEVKLPINGKNGGHRDASVLV